MGRKSLYSVFSISMAVVLCFTIFWINYADVYTMPWKVYYPGKISRRLSDSLTKDMADIDTNSNVAEDLTRTVRLACFIATRSYDLSKLKAVNSTWGKRCDKMLYVMTSSNSTAHDILSVPFPDSYHSLNQKIVYTFKYLYNTSLDFDWFLKADDDTYVLVENLKFLLSHFNKDEPIFIGDHFRHFGPNGFMSGGAGYVLSREGLRMLIEKGYNVPGICSAEGKEDVEMGRCLSKAGVAVRESVDVQGKGSFHALQPKYYIQSGLPTWLQSHMLYNSTQGLSCCSSLTVSFHRLSPSDILLMELLLYRISVYGHRSPQYGQQKPFFRGRKWTRLPPSLPRKPYYGENTRDYYKTFQSWRTSKAKNELKWIGASTFKLSMRNTSGYYLE